jgi:hypothetical protein
MMQERTEEYVIMREGSGSRTCEDVLRREL